MVLLIRENQIGRLYRGTGWFPYRLSLTLNFVRFASLSTWCATLNGSFQQCLSVWSFHISRHKCRNSSRIPTGCSSRLLSMDVYVYINLFDTDNSVDVYLDFVIVLLANFFGGIAMWSQTKDYGNFSFSLMAMIILTPLSFLCWFRPLYKAFRSDSSFNFMVFFFVFFCQLVMSIIWAIGVPGTGSW